MRVQEAPNEPGHALSAILILVLVILIGFAFGFGMSTDRPAPPGMGPVFMGLFLVALGAMFFASYFFSQKAYFLRWLLSLSTGLFPRLNDRRMAFLFSAIAFGNGVIAIADGLGISL